MTKQQEKSLLHYESEQWKTQWSENKLKKMLQHVEIKPLKEKCDIDDKDELL